MSTRSTIHFIDSSFIDPKTNKPYLSSIIYRHCDGYPSVGGVDLFKFLSRCQNLKDTRLKDASYLAAKYVVFLAEMFAIDYHFDSPKPRKPTPKKERLDFISVGVMMSDPGDIEYRYTVDCGKIGEDGLPEVKCYSVSINDDGKDSKCEEVPIPEEETEKT